ncbi:MAG: hypothetical protein V1799_16920 [bacterium]
MNCNPINRTRGTRPSRTTCGIPQCVAWLLLSALSIGNLVTLSAQQETIYMSVLASRKHRIGAQDNPTVGLFVSTDQGLTWCHRNWTTYIRTFYTEAGNDGTLWSGCNNGVFRSTDQGASWRITTGWQVTEVLKVKADPQHPSIVYAATAYGILKSTDAGETWKEKNNGFQSTFTPDVVVDKSSSRNVLAATEEGIYRSTNGGDRWQRATLAGTGIRVIVQDPIRAHVFWAGTEDYGLVQSVDAGKTWKPAGKELSGFTIYTIAVDPKNSQRIFVGTFGKGVYRSLDGGETWQSMNGGLSNLVVHSLAILPSNPSIVFTGTLNGGLFRSTDGGTSWKYNSQDEGQVWGLFVR